MLWIVLSQHFDWVLFYSVDMHHDNSCIVGWIYFCKGVHDVYSFSLADIYFFGFKVNKFSTAWGQVLFLHLNMRHKILKMFVSYIFYAPISLKRI